MMDIGQAGYKCTAIAPNIDLQGTVHPDLWAIEITEGKFEGLKYKYTNWAIKIEEPYRQLEAEPKRRLLFDFDIMTEPPNGIDCSKKNLEMLSMMGNILLDILVNTAKIPKTK